MAKFFTFILCFLLITSNSFSNTIIGSIKDKSGKELAYSSILIKGTAKGTTANSKGNYSLSVEKNGTYVLVCQHIGYKSVEKKITVNSAEETVDFELEQQEYKLTDVVVNSNSVDPAYEIIKQAIKKREFYLNEIKKFECEVYIKGQMQLRDYPKKFMGEKVDFEDGDTSKKKMLFYLKPLLNTL